ncbi:hypothetical protein [Paracidovorax anthurii]|uniref:Uncharacterized protein n=1 Tax=Paracidovorax anthurii TaxID=78229 RepID=A0A328ZJJ4_9BURK|nr:hypothetical protein [Paracidovorax anthurii]RAR86071.1 hypothetical protein AX018_100232 [Paracidovorax anthurii]
MTSATYTPRSGSVVSRVIEFLEANPDEQLDADLISAKCECDRRNVHTLLGPAVQAGLLRRTEEIPTGELVYTLGTGKPVAEGSPAGSGFHGWLDRKGQQSEEGRPKRSPATPAPAPAAPPAVRRSPAAPFLIKVDKDVPLPSRRPAMDWTPLLDRLEVGDSFTVPYAARSSISSALKAYKDETQKVLASRTLGSEIRVWRTK